MIKITEPMIANPIAIDKPLAGLIFPDGIGRFFVRGIFASVSLSCQWFKAPELHDIKNTPTPRYQLLLSRNPVYKMYPVNAEKATDKEILTLPNSVKILRKSFKMLYLTVLRYSMILSTSSSESCPL